MEDVGSRKTLCPVRKLAGRALAGQAGRKVIGWRKVVGLVRKNAWRGFVGKADGDIGRKLGSPGSLNLSPNLQAIAITPAGRCKQQKRKDKK